MYFTAKMNKSIKYSGLPSIHKFCDLFSDKVHGRCSLQYLLYLCRDSKQVYIHHIYMEKKKLFNLMHKLTNRWHTGSKFSLVCFSDLADTLLLSHFMTLSHIHGGYTRSEQPVQAPNQVHWCCLATPKRP